MAERFLTPLDVKLLERLAAEPNLVRAARSIGVARDRAVYRLERLARLFGGPVALGHRGGRTPGGTALTALGRKLLRNALPETARPTNRWAGTYRSGPPARVELDAESAVEVSFRARDGARVAVAIDPDDFVVARRRFELSARNVLPITVESVRPRRDRTALLTARWHGHPIRVSLTARSVGRLRLMPGTRAFLYAKAVAARRVA